MGAPGYGSSPSVPGIALLTAVPHTIRCHALLHRQAVGAHLDAVDLPVCPQRLQVRCGHHGSQPVRRERPGYTLLLQSALLPVKRLFADRFITAFHPATGLRFALGIPFIFLSVTTAFLSISGGLAVIATVMFIGTYLLTKYASSLSRPFCATVLDLIPGSPPSPPGCPSTTRTSRRRRTRRRRRTSTIPKTRTRRSRSSRRGSPPRS